MQFFRRVNDILSANLHDLVDAFEDPEQMLRHAVREMETALDRVLDGTAKVIATEKLLAAQLRDREQQSDQFHHRARQAAAAGDEPRAKHFLIEKHRFDNTSAVLRKQLAATQEQSAALRRHIDAMRLKLEEARHLQTTLAARHRAALARKELLAASNGLTADGSAFGRFERLRTKVEQCEAEADARIEFATLVPDNTDSIFDVEQEFRAISPP